MATPNKNAFQLTEETLKAYQDELRNLIQVERPKVIAEIKDARAQGDLSENSEYDAARDKQGKIEDRVKELENILNRAEVISERKSDTIGIGSKVRILNMKTNKEYNLQIVGTYDADPFAGRISHESALAKSILGYKKGDVVEVDTPVKYNVTILDV